MQAFRCQSRRHLWPPLSPRKQPTSSVCLISSSKLPLPLLSSDLPAHCLAPGGIQLQLKLTNVTAETWLKCCSEPIKGRGLWVLPEMLTKSAKRRLLLSFKEYMAGNASVDILKPTVYLTSSPLVSYVGRLLEPCSQELGMEKQQKRNPLPDSLLLVVVCPQNTDQWISKVTAPSFAITIVLTCFLSWWPQNKSAQDTHLTHVALFKYCSWKCGVLKMR